MSEAQQSTRTEVQELLAHLNGLTESDKRWFDLFDKLPRLLRTELLLNLSADQVENMLCKIKKAYGRIYCGDVEPAPTQKSDDYKPIPDRDVVYELWQQILERDYGVSHQVTQCTGYTRAEREMTAKAMRTRIPIENRLNAYLAQSYAGMHRYIRRAGETDFSETNPVQQIYALHKNTVFFREQTESGAAFVSVAAVPEIAYVAVTGDSLKASFRILPLNDPEEDIDVHGTNVHGGVYLISSLSRRESYLVCFGQQHIYVSPAIPHGDGAALTDELVFCDPLNRRRFYLLTAAPPGEPEDRLVQYAMEIPETEQFGPQNVFQNFPIVLVGQTTNPRITANDGQIQSYKLFFENFTISLQNFDSPQGMELQFAGRQSGRSTIRLPDIASFESGHFFVVPIGNADNTEGRMRLVWTGALYSPSINLNRGLAILHIDFVPGTARVQKAICRTIETANVRFFKAEIVDETIVRIFFYKAGDPSSSRFLIYNLVTGSYQAIFGRQIRFESSRLLVSPTPTTLDPIWLEEAAVTFPQHRMHPFQARAINVPIV